MNRNVIFNTISEITFLSVVPCILIIYIIYQFGSKENYIINFKLIKIYAAFIYNISILFEFLNLVFMVKQSYSHLNKRLSKWRNGTVSRPISLMKYNERRMRCDKAVKSI